MDVVVNAKRITDDVTPTRAEYSRKSAEAVAGAIFVTLADK
jgi:hypothetical protein